MVLIISTPGGNLVHKFDVVGEWPASNSISKSTEQTKKSGKSASPQITSPSFLPKLSKRNGVNHLIFQQEFPVFPCKHYSGGSRGGARGARAPFFFTPNWAPKGRKKDHPPPPFISGSGWQGFPPPLPEGLDTSLNSLAFSTFSISLSVQTSTVYGFAGLFISQAPIANV